MIGTFRAGLSWNQAPSPVDATFNLPRDGVAGRVNLPVPGPGFGDGFTAACETRRRLMADQPLAWACCTLYGNMAG